MALRKRGRVWHVYFRDLDGRVTEQSLHVTDREDAERLHVLFMRELRARRGAAAIFRRFPDLAPKPEPVVEEQQKHQRGGIALARMLDVAERKRSISDTHRRRWRQFLAVCPVKYADEVTPKVALAVLEKHFGRGNGKSYNNVKSVCNTIFRCCLVEAGLSGSPFAAIINRRVETVETHRNLTDAEIAAVMPHLSPALQVLTMLSRWTCQRLETCARMTPEMFDFERLVFVIEPGKTRRFGKWVCVPIMPELEEYLRPLLPKCASGVPIVRNFCSEKATNHYFSKKFRDAVREAGIPDTAAGKASFHSLRGSAITYFKEHGVKGEELRAITGHGSDQVEDIYARDIASLARIAENARKRHSGRG